MGTVIDKYLRVVDELVRLERANVLGLLDGAARTRWLELTRSLFGVAAEERRHHFRLQAHHVARILDLGEGQIAHVTSLGMGGLFLQLDWVGDSLLNRTLDLELFLPLDEIAPVRCRVEVQRLCLAAGRGGDAPGIGVAFVDLSGEKQSVLLRYIKQRLMNMGRVTASVAHNINNPLAFMNQNLSMLHEYVGPVRQLIRFAREMGEAAPVPPQQLDALDGDLDDLIEETLEGGRRIQTIVEELRVLSHEDELS
jgi:signal transduction histidine kinase